MNKLNQVITKHETIKRKICEACGITTATLWNWRHDVCAPSPIYREKINEIFIKEFNEIIFE